MSEYPKDEKPSQGRVDREKSLAFSKSVVSAATSYLDRVTVCLTGFNEQYIPVEVASGTLIKIQNRHFVMTCGHFVKKYATKNISMSHSSSAKDQFQPVIHPFINKWYISEEDEGRFDLGCLEIEPDQIGIANLEMSFIDTESLWLEKSTPEKEQYVLVGFPRDLIPQEGLKNREIRIRLLSYGTRIKPIDNPQIEGDYNFVVSYKASQTITWGPGAEELVGESFPSPFGLSGGGIWKLNILSPSEIWSPTKMQLVGIQYQWWEGREEAQGNYVKYWLEELFDKQVIPNPN